MAYRGKNVNQKLVDKIENSLRSWLEKDETVIAVFKANRVKPQVDSIIVTNRRVFCANTIFIESGKGFISDTVASEIRNVRVDTPKSRLMRSAYPAKLIIEHPDGTEDYLASIRESDTPAATKAIQRVSGSSKHLAISEQVGKEYRQKKAQERKRKAEEKAANKRDLEAIRAEERAFAVANSTNSMTSSGSPTNNLEKVARSSKNAANRLNKISNRLLIVVVLLVVGIIFFPIGIIAWIFAIFAFLTIFND